MQTLSDHLIAMDRAGVGMELYDGEGGRNWEEFDQGLDTLRYSNRSRWSYHSWSVTKRQRKE